MRRLCFGFLALPLLVLADDVSKLSKIDELMTLMDSEALSRQMTEQARRNVQAQVARPEAPPELRPIMDEYATKMADVLTRRLNWTILKPKVRKIYAESFSESEVDAILAFYRSPAGHSLVTKMPGVMTQSMTVGQEELESARPEIQQLSDEMIAKMKEKAKQTAK